MNVLIFQDKKFSGGIQEVISQIQTYYASMLKYIDMPENQIQEKIEALKKEEKSLAIMLRNCKDEEKSSTKEKLKQIRSQIHKLDSIILVQQKIEELSNFSKSSGASGTLDEVEIQVFEIIGNVPSSPPQPSHLLQNEEVKKEPIDQAIDQSKTAIQRQCEEYMTFAKPMPECFEKTLIRICYCLSILQTISQEGPDAILGDGVLFFKTKEEMLGQLKQDWTKIKQQISDEKIEESSVEKQLKEMIEYFTNTHPLDYNYDYLNNLMNLLQKVRPFSFQEFFHLISKCETNSDRINNKDIVLLLGTTGAGKSTTIQYLYGARMGQAKDGHIQAAEMPKQLEDFVSSAAMCSITRYINPLHVNFVNEDEEEESFEIVDTPGFGDTQSVEVDISNTIGIIRSVTKANKVYPVFLFSEKNVGGRAEIMKGLINFYSCLIKDMSKNVRSCNFFFSHFSDKNKDMEEFLKSIIKHLNPQEHSNLILKDVLKHMRELGQQKKLLILDPLDGKHKKVLKQILETDAIANPRNKFSLNIVERSRNFLDKQIQLHEKAILDLVSKGNTELALWKIEELITLNEIFIQFEPTYKDTLQSLISQIMSQVNKIIDSVLERMQICLKGSNELYDTDIAKFQEALQFERKIMPLIDRIRNLDIKSGDKEIFSDQQKQSQLISAVTSQCELNLSQVDKLHEINEDEWIHFITKAIKLSQNIQGFELIEKNCLDRFTEKFQKFAQTAKKIIYQAQITDYATLAQYSSQLSNEEGKKSKVSFKSKKQFDEDSEGIKTDSDIDQIDQKKKFNNPQILSSSDSQEEIQSDHGKVQVIHQNNKSNEREKPMHNKFKELVAILVQSHMKIRVVQNKEFIDNLEKQIKEVISYVLNLEEKVKPHFKFFQQGNQQVFQILCQDDILKIMQSLTMLESYNNACQNIDKNIKQNLEKLFEKYKGKCKSLFDVHNQKFLEIAQQQDANKADEIKMRYDQILLLIQIQQIQEQTSTHFQFIKVWLQNKIQFSINEIESILQQFGSQTSDDVSNTANIKGTSPQIKRLKEALTSLKTLSETQKEGDQFIKSKYKTMQECFDKLISKIYQDATQFSNLAQEFPKNILPIASSLEQIEEIYLAAEIINIKSNLKEDIGIEWIESVKQTLQRIQIESEKLNDIFMKQKDYRNYESFFNYLRMFTEGQNSSTQLLLRKVNTLLQGENQAKINPQSILTNLKGYLQDQADKKIKVFEQLFSKLQDITSVGPSEMSDSEESKEQNLNLQQDQVGDQMKTITFQIIELFKIEYDVKAKYPHLSQQILDCLPNNEDEYFLKHYTSKFLLDYFSILEKNKISNKSTKWIYLKLQSIKYLRELDEYLYNLRGKSTVKDIYQILDDRYYQDPSSEVSKAKENFEKSFFEEIKDQLDQLSQFTNDNNNQIKSKIITYLNQQIFTKYEQIMRNQSYDLTISKSQISVIASNIEQLLKIDQQLDQYIKIQGQSVKDIIEKDILSYLQHCFSSYQTQIDKYLIQQNFYKVFQKIEEANNLFKEFHSKVGIDARKIEAFKELKSISDKISGKIISFKESIENLQQKILSSKTLDFNYKFNPKTFIENISKIEDQKIIDWLSLFEVKLEQRNIQKLKDISNKRDNTKDLSELKVLLIDIETEKDCLQFYPDQKREEMKSNLDQEKIQIKDKIKQIQSKEIEKFKSELKHAEKAEEIIQVLSLNKNIIDEDIQDHIKNEISQKLSSLIKLFENKLQDQQLDEVIHNYIPQIQEFFDQPDLQQQYINTKFSEAYAKLLEQVNYLVKNAIAYLSKFFVETHSNTTGEPIQLDINQFKDDKFLKVQIGYVKSVCQISLEKNKLAEIFKFDERLKTFVEDSTQYIRNIKNIHRATLKQNLKENMASLSNLGFTTSYIINQDEFKDLLTKLKGVFEEQIKEFIQEIQEYDFTHMQDETFSWLQQLKKPLWDQQFTDKNRSQEERANFYKIIQKNYDLIDQAQHIDSLMIPARVPTNKSKKSQPFTIKEDYYQRLMENIKSIQTDLEQQTKQIKYAHKENKFDVLYSSLKSMQDHLPIVRQFIEEAIKNSEQEVKDYLNHLISSAKLYYQNEQHLDLNKLSLRLIDIQAMKVNYILFDELIKNTLDTILEDYQKFREKDSQAAINLQNHLRGIPGPEGPLLAQTHSYFQGTNILKANELFQKKTIHEVIQLLAGTDLGENEKNQLVQYYEQYLETYKNIIEEKLIVKTDSSGQRMPIDVTSIISNIKNKLSSEESKKWNEKDIFGDIKLGQPQKNMKKLSVLLGNIFSLWSLLNSDYYLKQEKTEGQNKLQLQNYLLQPHPAQIVSILRMLGVGYSKQFNIGAKIGQFVNWVKHFGSGEEDSSTDMRNNLVQIRTGEGKSVVLAVVSIIFALNGFEVNCACYSNYLSERDYNDFQKLFNKLGVTEYIKYGTFNEIAEYKINKECNIRESIMNLVIKPEFKKSTVEIKDRIEQRPQVLLIDEVDVFFSDEFFGQTYNPQALIHHDAISPLIDLIWSKRQSMVKQQSIVNYPQSKQNTNKDANNRKNQAYMSLKGIKDSEQYKNAQNIFKPEFQFLVEEATKKMIIDVVDFESDNHKYVVLVHKDAIGYYYQDQISINQTRGYKTLFAYYDENLKNHITPKTLKQKKAIGINCGSFSYAEVPLDYQIILGVTGTLKTLSDIQKQIIENLYSIKSFTYSPSVHLSDETETLIFNPSQDIKIIKSNEYVGQLVKMVKKFIQFKRPVIIFFENVKKLKAFIKLEPFQNFQTLTEVDNNKEKESKILKATQVKQITLTTKTFGRGTDFRCYDKQVIEAEGLVVIQTFLSHDLSEEIQIRGRTGRQGTEGKYILFLKQEELADFDIQEKDIKESKDYYKTLCEFRSKKLNASQNELLKFRELILDDHNKSNLMVEDVIKLAKNQYQYDPKKIIHLTEHLLNQNKGITLETDDLFMKVLILIDCTGSMGATLQKTKNCVRAMIEEARAELKKNHLSEDLILIKIGGYRNYSSLEEQLFQVSPDWERDPQNLTKFLDDKLQTSGGQGNEAMEIGLAFANKEIRNGEAIPLQMVIVIGDAAPNTPEEVINKRNGAAQSKNDPNYWQTTIYKDPTNWEKEINLIKAAQVPVYSFYINKNDRKSYDQLAVNGGKSAFLDITSEAKGQQQLKDFFKYLMVLRAMQINRGQEEALKSVQDIKVSFN